MSHVRKAAAITLLLSLASAAAQEPLGGQRLTPQEVEATESAGPGAGTSGVAGIRWTVLHGDPSKAGLYTIVVRVPANTRIEAHDHPDDRVVSVVSGTWQFGYGASFSESALKRLGPGSFYTEPPNLPHFARTGRTPVVIHISGYGPTGTRYVSQNNKPAAAGEKEPIWDANKVEMTKAQLAPGVYAFFPRDAKELNDRGGAAATSAGLIVGSKGALQIDTMLNRRLFDQVEKLGRQVTDRPLLYAVNTSFHGDHAYGNIYLPARTKIIQHEFTKTYLEQHLADDKAFMIQNFGKGRGIEEIRARNGDVLVKAGETLTIDLGDRQVQIKDFGYAQTGGDLFVWEPQSKVLWTGNPVIAAKPSLPWLLGGHLVETLETLKRVYAFLPEDARIVPGHGVTIGREDMRWQIDYLSAVKREVQKAIDDGLTLEQTVERVKLPEFSGYVLFGWVHPGLNVPAAYKDLSATRVPSAH